MLFLSKILLESSQGSRVGSERLYSEACSGAEARWVRGWQRISQSESQWASGTHPHPHPWQEWHEVNGCVFSRRWGARETEAMFCFSSRPWVCAHPGSCGRQLIALSSQTQVSNGTHLAGCREQTPRAKGSETPQCSMQQFTGQEHGMASSCNTLLKQIHLP